MVMRANGKGDGEELIIAVGYLRKSTKGERIGRDGQKRQRQEKSLAQQKAEIIKLAGGRFKIVKWFEDEGISGWKRGAKRPDFQRMLDEVQGLGAKAILCDNIDRFSRATYDDVQEDTSALRKAGVRWIVTASHGEYDLSAGRRNDIGGIITFATAAWAAHEFSRQLSRRVTLARRNAADEGKRTGGPAPYGLANDGKGGLTQGDAEKAQRVRWLFEQVGKELRSLHSIAGDLNAQNVPGPSGGKWFVKTIVGILRNRSYRGDFTFNQNPEGQFYGIDGDGEVVEKEDLNGASKVFLHEGLYDSLVDPAVFDRVQERLDTLKDRSRRKRMGYTLSGILKCDHCGQPMYGLRDRTCNNAVIYRCSGDSSHGKGACGYRQVREDLLLPFLLRLLGKEFSRLRELISLPPDHLVEPSQERDGRRLELERQREDLTARIDKAEENLLSVEDSRTLKSLNARITEMRDELERLDAELAANPQGEEEFTRADREALLKWWDEYEATACSVPVPSHANLALAGGLFQDSFAEESAVLADPRKVNDVLHQLGCEVRLRWETLEYISRAGKLRRRHVLVRGRFRLGQSKGKLPVSVLEPAVGRARRGSH